MQHEPADPHTRARAPQPDPPVDVMGSIELPDLPVGLAPGMYAHGFLPAAVPKTWEVAFQCPNGRRYRSRRHGLSVIASGWEVADMTSIDPMAPQQCLESQVQNCHVCPKLVCHDCTAPRAQWMHISIARKSKRPTMDDIDLVHRVFLGGVEAVIYMGALRDKRLQNIAHLFARADGGRVMAVPALLMR